METKIISWSGAFKITLKIKVTYLSCMTHTTSQQLIMYALLTTSGHVTDESADGEDLLPDLDKAISEFDDT